MCSYYYVSPISLNIVYLMQTVGLIRSLEDSQITLVLVTWLGTWCLKEQTYFGDFRK